MLRRLASSPSGTLVAWLLAFVGGIAAHAFDERVWGLPVWSWPGVSGGLALTCFYLRRMAVGRLVAGGALLFVCALWRFDAAFPAAEPLEPPAPGSVEIIGTVSREPRILNDSAILDLDRVFICGRGAGGRRGSAALVGGMPKKGDPCRPLAGVLRLRSRAWPVFAFGDVLRSRCAPAAVALGGGDPFDDQAWLDGVRWRCTSREPVELAAHGEASFFRTALYGLRSKIRAAVGRLLPEPEASFLLGLLIGDRDGLPSDLVAGFRATGTSHILAVSGYNVSRVAEVFLLLLAAVTVKRRRAAWLSVAGILVFAAIAGAEASVIRAAAMGCTALVAAAAGRRYSSAVALSLAAAAMLAFEPLLLRHDVGFQLSFAAVLGLHHLGAPLTERLRFLPEFLGIRRSAGETLGATLATLPVIILAFGRVPLVGPVANLLILPLIPWIMVLGVCSIIFSAVLFPAGLVPAVAATWLLRAIEAIVGFLAKLPLALELQTGAFGCSLIAGWLLLLWYALARAKPVVIWRPPLPQGIDVEVIEYDDQP